MNNARFAKPEVFFRVQPQHPWLDYDKQPLLNPASGLQSYVAANASPAWARKPKVCAHKPLRVVRILDAEQTQNSVGRLRISGRMAEVCAELDRLAAREAALL